MGPDVAVHGQGLEDCEVKLDGYRGGQENGCGPEGEDFEYGFQVFYIVHSAEDPWFGR